MEAREIEARLIEGREMIEAREIATPWDRERPAAPRPLAGGRTAEPLLPKQRGAACRTLAAAHPLSQQSGWSAGQSVEAGCCPRSNTSC